MYIIELPVFRPGHREIRHTVTLQAETICGLVVHRDHDGRGWVVSNKALRAVYGTPVFPTRLETRAQARHAARAFAPLMPDEVKSGEWNGNEWLRRDPDRAHAFIDAQRLYKVTG